MKCGTTSLHRYLDKHPDIAMSRDKELRFFHGKLKWKWGVDWYASQFASGTRIRGESSPGYTAKARLPGVPARMHSIVPDARLIYMVRDPIERVISHWIHSVSEGWEKRTFDVAAVEERYLNQSRYWSQISLYLEHYPRDRILVIEIHDLAENRAATLRRVYEFLDVDPDVRIPREHWKNRTADKRVKTRAGKRLERSRLGRALKALPQRWYYRLRDPIYLPFTRRIDRPTMTARTRASLVETFRDDANRFREFAGRDFSDWSV